MSERRSKAPHTNRGAENTYEYPIIIDYITFSGHFHTFEEMIDFLGLKNADFEFKPIGPRWFYKYAMCYDNMITLMLSNNDSITSGCVNISGKGCRLLESFSCYSLVDIINRVTELYDFQLTRVDIAMDVFDDKFDIQTLVKNYRKGNYTCRSKFSNLMESIDDGIKGTSLYFGKKSSNIFINIYDKRAERGYSPEDMPNWTRFEIRLRGPNAVGFGEKLYEDCDVGFFTSAYSITIFDLLLILMMLTKADYQRRPIGRNCYRTLKKSRFSVR